jgi:hypothetical protein
MTRPGFRLGLTAVLVVAAAMVVGGASAFAVSGAVSTTDNDGFVDNQGTLPYTDQACLNGHGVNCNIYLDKRDVWFSGLPIQAALGSGTYVFSVQVPGGQPTPNDGGGKNLSDQTCAPYTCPATNADGSAVPSGDTAINREFSINGAGTITNLGGHNFDQNKIQLFPYDDTTNNGGVYILAVCKISGDQNTTAIAVPSVDPRDCKYDAFKVNVGSTQTPPAADLIVTKDAIPTFTNTFGWSVTKGVDACQVTTLNPKGCQITGGSKTLNYTVTYTKDSGTPSEWQVNGTISVFNPNSFDIDGVTVTDSVNNGGDCSITDTNAGSDESIPALTSVDFPYTCMYANPPDPNKGTNTATATWDQTAYGTPDDSANFMVDFMFNDGSTGNPTVVHDCVSVSDNNPGNVTSGSAPFGTICATTTFTYGITVTVPTNGGCLTINNTASFTATDDATDTGSSEVVAQVCFPLKTSALTIGFWKTTNGQALIGTYCAPLGKQSLASYLSSLSPFADAAGKGCSQLQTYVTSILKGATATNMNVMLRAQMLGTALDVYFSDPTMGYTTTSKSGKKPPSTFLTHGALGGVNIDTTAICPMSDNSTTGTAACKNNTPSTNGFASGAFPAACMTVQGILTYESGNPPFNGSTASPVWYGGSRTLQEIAKNTYDQINNQDAFGC